MQHDGHQIMGEICGCGEELLSNIIEIQNQYMQPRKTDWAHNLRFLRIPEVGLEQSCRFCGIIDTDAIVLHLTEKHEQAGITNYVCVFHIAGNLKGDRTMLCQRATTFHQRKAVGPTEHQLISYVELLHMQLPSRSHLFGLTKSALNKVISWKKSWASTPWTLCIAEAITH
jgi:hypothetical protein